MTIVVTGSAGRVGSKVVRRLLEQGETVRGFDLNPSGIEHPAYSEVLGTFDDADKAAAAFEGATIALHLGAFMSWLAADAPRVFRANVDGTQVVAAAAAKAKVSRFVFASSGEVYPEGAPQSLPITEDHPRHARSVYGLTKLLGEDIVRFFERTAGIPTTILRFSHTQDASELLDETSFFSGPRFFLQPKIRQQEAFGNAAAVAVLKAADDGQEALIVTRNEDGRPYRMHITETRDMVEGVLLAMRHEAAAGETFNLGSDEPVDFAEALPLMQKATGLPLRTVDLPGVGVYYHTSNAKIKNTLGYAPRWTLESMIEEAAEARRTRLAS
jgi:UDP-glucose 4-epimerase